MNKILKAMNKDIDQYYQNQKDIIKKQYSFYKTYSIKKPVFALLCVLLLLIFNIYQYQTDLKPITKTVTITKKSNDNQKQASIESKTKKEITIYQKQDKYIHNTYILITINILIIIYIIYKKTNKT